MIQIQINFPSLSADSFMSLIKAVGWSDESALRLDGLKLAIQSSSSHYSVWKDGQLIGLARVLSDQYIFSTIPEILIHPSFQRMGIGKAIMEQIIKDYGHTILFFGAQAGNEAFFEKLGFRKGPQSYERLFHRPQKTPT